MGHRQAPLAERLWEKVRKGAPNECWPWTGGLTVGGYGIIRPGRPSRKHLGTHRVAYEIAEGPIPAGLFVLHRCDNRRCCNPSHLFLGTQQDNIDDMYAKGRARVGSDHGMARLTDDDVRTIYSRAGRDRSEDIAATFDISLQTVGKIARRERWAALTENLPPPPWPRSRAGINTRNQT